MKQQKIKQLALLGLASGLLAATATAQAAEKSNNGSNRSPNRTQPIAGCSSGSGGGCGAVADNYAPSSCGGGSSYSGSTTHSGCAASSQPSQGGSSYNEEQHPGDRHDLIQAGCAPHTYSVNSPNEQYDPARHGKPDLGAQTQVQPQSTFRYIGDTTVPPRDLQPSSNGLYKTAPNFQPSQQSSPYSNPTSSRPNNSSRFLSDTAIPSSTSMPSSSPVYNTPASNRPQGNPAPFNQAPPSSMTPSSTHMSPSPYSPQAPHNTMNDQQRYNHTRMEDNAVPAPKTEPTKKTFW